MAISTYLSIITLNINGLNAPSKKAWSGGIDQKQQQDPSICYLRDSLQP